MTAERRRPRDEEEAAAFKGMGKAVTINRERRGIARDEFASACEMTPAELEEIDRGTVNERWGRLRRVANRLDMPLSALVMEAEELAPPGPDSRSGGRRGR